LNDRLLYSRKEAAFALSVCLSTVEALIDRGELKTRRMGRRVLIPRAELLRVAGKDIPELWPAKQDGKTVRVA
jgi:excisionase family DNA binding protein